MGNCVWFRFSVILFVLSRKLHLFSSMGQSKSATHLAEVVAPVTKFISYMISNYCRICPCIRHSSLFSCITIRECSYANDNRKVFTLTGTVPEKLRKLTKEFLSEVYNKQESSAYILTLTVYGSIFIQMFLMGSVKRFFFCNSVVQGHLRSLILVPIESVCDFLSVHHSNLGPILHHFRDIAGLFSWPHPYSALIFGCSRRNLDQIAHVGSDLAETV